MLDNGVTVIYAYAAICFAAIFLSRKWVDIVTGVALAIMAVVGIIDHNWKGLVLQGVILIVLLVWRINEKN